MSRYINYQVYPKQNIIWTDEESQLLCEYTAKGYTPREIACAMKRDETEVILHGIALGVLTVSRVEQKLPIQPLDTNCNPDEWNRFSSEPRTLDKIIRMTKAIRDKVFFACHKAMQYDVERGLVSVDPHMWAKEVEAAEKIVREQGIQNLGPYSETEWGMLLGKLSALRWVLGCAWDFLDI